MAAGNTTTGALADSLDTIQAAARSRRQFDGVMPQLVDRVELDANTGTSWRKYSSLISLLRQLQRTQCWITHNSTMTLQ